MVCRCVISLHLKKKNYPTHPFDFILPEFCNDLNDNGLNEPKNRKEMKLHRRKLLTWVNFIVKRCLIARKNKVVLFFFVFFFLSSHSFSINFPKLLTEHVELWI